MSETIRSFVAVQVDDSKLLREVIGRLHRLGRAVKPVDASQLHVTLKFLGETNVTQIDQICSALEQAVMAQSACEIRTRGLGAFPHLERPNVIWAGLEDGESLSLIAANLERDLLSLGFRRDRKPFHPHLTLARIKSRPPAELRDIVDEYRDTEFSSGLLESVELIQSELRSDGPRYTVLYSGRLAESRR